MMHNVTKATPIQFIDGMWHVKKRKGRKTALSGYYVCRSCDLLLMLSWADTYIYNNVREQNNVKKAFAHGPQAHTCLV